MFDDGQEVRGSVYALENKAGVGLDYSLWDKWGTTSLYADYNKPVDDFVEMVVEHGVKHDIYAERKLLIDQYAQARVFGGFTSYAMDGITDAADAPGWGADLDYVRPVKLFDGKGTEDEGGDVTLGCHYSALAEYFTHIAQRIDTANQLFTPLPTADYEVHDFSVTAAKNLMPELTTEIQAGMGVNRMTGQSGPLYSLVIKYDVVKDISLNFHASRNMLGGQNDSEKEDILGANMKWAY